VPVSPGLMHELCRDARAGAQGNRTLMRLIWQTQLRIRGKIRDHVDFPAGCCDDAREVVDLAVSYGVRLGEVNPVLAVRAFRVHYARPIARLACCWACHFS
jgi:hypothetical protein